MGHIFLSFLFYNIILIIVYKHYKRGEYYIKKTDLFFYTLLLIAYGTYGNGEGDYLHYKENVNMIHSLYDVLRQDGMEIQYNYLSFLVDGNYDLWRFVIFSIQFIGMSWLLYKAKLNTYPVLLGFITICLILYTYQRSYWGVIFYFLGVFLFLEKRNIVFLIIVALCYIAHTQNIVLLALLPVGFINLKKWHILAIILMFGIITTIFSDYFNTFLDSGGVEGADYINNKMSRYGESGGNHFGSSIGEYLIFILRYVPTILIILTCVRLILKNKYQSLYLPYRRIINIALGLVMVSLVFLFGSVGSATFFYRILSMTLFPVSLFLPYLVKNKIIKKQIFNNYINVFIICAELNYLKDLYYAYSHGI